MDVLLIFSTKRVGLLAGLSLVSPTLGTPAESVPMTIFVGWTRWTFRILLFCCAAVASHQITWKCAELAKQGSKVSLQKTARESQKNESPRLDGILM